MSKKIQWTEFAIQLNSDFLESVMFYFGKNDMHQTFNYTLYGYLGIMITGNLRERNVMFTNTHKQRSKNSFRSDTLT